ncbi:bifunctional 4-hydroxy-2-oxoglutarate aldolase/2-dehydro-3-deoxy-phosphogluconate aldolase [Curvivirga sp.]|uniref:bifunctional 4-hydroxy-2-oxoglutarate aldolase/2-dehydro-3-deoxy-phosphogluconate aldolase n=1 Tax=Curvivirga sp. TaxID=2856848 RepID=UPI003B5B9773
MSKWNKLLQDIRVVPVLVIEDVEKAVPLAKTLCEAGLHVLEITLRTKAALPAIKAIKDNVPEAILGVGTVLDHEQIDHAANHDCQFFVSPGHTPNLVQEAKQKELPFLFGANTLSEMMFLREQGFIMQKFFPAELNGGVKLLKAAYSVLPDVQFCPTGGISIENAEDYLNLPNVACIGGSWIAPKDLITSGDWDKISKLAKHAATLGR